jgi:hypothetical protein
MSIRSFFVRLSLKAAAVAVFAWGGSSVSAADVTVPPAPVAVAAPVSVGAPGCATCQNGGGESCQHGAIRSKCNVCGKLLGSHLHKDKKAPFPVTLCPGACFGYFQTQWRKWDEVCPYPYLGTGVSDAPKPPAGVLNPRPGTGLEAPRPLDPNAPKMTEPKKSGTSGTGSITIPVIVPSKFGP